MNAGRRNGRVALQGAGQVKFRAHRPLPETAKLGQITVLHACSGRWWLTIACELPEPDGRQPDGPFEPVGIDVGIHSFVALSTGERIPGVHAERHARRELRQAHRRVSRRQRGSRSRLRAVRRLARVQEKVAGARRTHHHTVARRLVRQHSVLAVEDLRVSRMTRSARGSVEYPGTGVRRKAGLNRAILDQGWAVFVRCLEAKLEEAGGILVRVDPYGTSQQCPSCGRPAPKPFHQRLHRCQGCGLVEDRDVAAAQVVANRAAHMLKRLGREPGGGRARGRTDEAESCRPVDDSQDTGIVTGGPLSSIPPSLRHGAAQQSEQSFALAVSDAKGIAAQLSDQPPEWRQPRSCGRTTCAADG